MIPSPRTSFGLAAATAIALTACSPASGGTAGATSLTVAAGFYPLQYVAQQVGAHHVEVFSLTPSGVEPHDIELSPAAVRGIGEADLVLYVDGFQPAVENAIATMDVPSLDAAAVVALSATGDHDDGHDGDADSADDHDHGVSDPHFWLEPALLAQYATAVGAEFAALDPDHAPTYRDNADELVTELLDLDATFRAELTGCERTDFVTAHEAFGYLARAYGLHQESIAGIEPDTEPSPARLLEIKRIIAATGATTIFTETLVSPKVADAVAQDTGVTTRVLDPLESVSDGDDYPGVMLRNLDALRIALGCGA